MDIGKVASIGCIVIAVLSAGVLTACGSKDTKSFISSAKTYLGKSDYAAAVIQLKNALQNDPDNREARVLLAATLLESGDAVGAEREARKAIGLHAPDDRTYPVLARALVAQGQFKKLGSELADVRPTDPSARSEIDTALAIAALASGSGEKAEQLIDAAITDQPKNARALLFKAQLVARGSGGPAAARPYVERALAAIPDHVEALVMRADIDQAEGKRAEAQKDLERAVDAHPNSILARSTLFSFAIQSRNLELAKAQLAKLREVAPKDLRTAYADALLASITGENARARDAIQTVLAARPDNLPSQFLLGLVDYQLGNYASAENTLRRVVAKAPNDATARHALALTYLRSGDAKQAIEALAPVLERFPDNPVLLRTAGEAYLASGNLALAERAYARANDVDKSNVGSQVRLAQVRLAAGDTKRAFDDLESLATQDASAYQADLALFSAHMRRREYDKALAAVDALEKKQPKAAMVPNLRGTVYLAKRDLKQARSSFEKALALQPDFLPAARNLAVVDVQEGKVAAARARYEAMLAKNPKSDAILLALAEVQALSGDPPDKVRETMLKAIAANPSSVQARMALLSFETRRGDSKAAMAAAQSALGAIPDNAQLVEALAAAQLNAGEANQAIETFKKLAAMQPKNPLPLLRLAEAQVAMKDYASAIDSDRKALAMKPDLVAGIVALTKTYLAAGQPDAAIAEARRLQKTYSDKAAGYVLEGEIRLSQKKLPEAIVAFKSAMDRQQLPPVVARYYVVLQAAGKAKEASALATKWMVEHPDDPTLPLLMAEENQRKNDLASAKAGYLKVLDIDPDNVSALNNLAWILADQKDAKAVEYAERAHRLAPFNSAIVDTLGWTLARSGDATRGVELLRMAARLSPANAEIRLHLAKTLIQTGDKSGARRELSDLTKLDKDAPARIEAEKLLATL
jgi:putative PEP-CTERM system TPR-repeat lipoprotein